MNMELFLNNENEKPLDNIVSDGGMAAIFRKVACVGDSLASGEFESLNPDGSHGYHDMFEYSWGQFFGRMCGSKVYNFSRGGMTAKEYCEGFADMNKFWSSEFAADAYVIALGANDLWNRNQAIGSVNDYTDSPKEPKDTFAYYYAEIIERYQKLQPRAKFFLFTFPKEAGDQEKSKAHRELMYAFAKKYPNTYVIDIFEYGVPYDEAFKKQFFMLGHMNPMGYLFTAKVLASYIDYIIRHNPEDFNEIGFIGTDLHA